MTSQGNQGHVDTGWVRQLLLEAGTKLSEESRDRVLKIGSEATQPLIEIIEDRELWNVGAPGEGWAPEHAAALLGELHPPEALDPMLLALADVSPLSSLTSVLIDALAEYADALVEPALAAIAEDDDKDYRLSLSYSLSKCGVEDERVYEQLLRVLRDEPEIGPGLLVDYGDPRALEDLGKAFDEFVVDENASSIANHAIIEIEWAIKELGGELSPVQKEKFHRALEPNRRFREEITSAFGSADESPPPAPKKQKLGRNEPCWCGSGKKYKKCHLRSDEEQSRDG